MSLSDPLTVTSSSHKNGSFILSALPGVIMVFPRGSWSMSCTRDYMSKIIALRKQAGIREFICLIEANKWQLGTPAVLQALSEFNVHAAEQGMVGQWLIDPSGSSVSTQILAKALTKNVSCVDVVTDIDACVERAAAVVDFENKEDIIRVYQQHST
ncbi:hypothetical protein [Alteromonas antoniana]|uniref:hypothetical protein n=1 Tax=Alteromonas antoniana TaxID=2803813 RepID=UPI001C45AE3C|nr:hypothetical protein [Alteromonas antoniana]